MTTKMPKTAVKRTVILRGRSVTLSQAQTKTRQHAVREATKGLVRAYRPALERLEKN